MEFLFYSDDNFENAELLFIMHLWWYFYCAACIPNIYQIGVKQRLYQQSSADKKKMSIADHCFAFDWAVIIALLTSG
ncbi:hypothetical protein T4B_15450 [Trichinella pseudospiralis]|uniref:Uncharacterized protein n=1 Tax=Trichinella pseudospiralis TaxID=6337 RepID=A0A0V1IT47_TRIPS|nr:hypothetical protein T4B_15450 [Trichinella pseudospiralis]